LTDRERGRFLADPRGVTLSVADDRGRPPHATPVRYAYVPGGDMTFFTGTQGGFSR
jgi:nitroimidazol reductase NimA-like FMN-containing flavoprotein (pyridoxamine 5'-phosphate oxidase superfamily)